MKTWNLGRNLATAALPLGALLGVVACSVNDGNNTPAGVQPTASVEPTTSTPAPTGGVNSVQPSVNPVSSDPGPIIAIPTGGTSMCGTLKCADLGWKCGSTTDDCGNVVNCADEGLTCKSGEVCVGGIDAPTECVSGGSGSCELCSFLPQCDDASPTRLTGRVVTPGRSDDDTGNQVGVPNALVYILQNNADTLPEIPVGVPSGGTACDRCEDQQSQLGDVLFGAVTDATGAFTIEKYVPVGQTFTLVVKAGKFRRAVQISVPEEAACTNVVLPTTLPDNPARLPRDVNDGLFVHIPKIGISTGQIDAMECVFSKIGLVDSEFGDPGPDGSAAARVHLYRGGNAGEPAGASIGPDTPHSDELYGTLERLQQYDMIVADCEGPSADSPNGRDSEASRFGDNVREYVNRGGRMFASHLSYSWLVNNGDQPYAEATPIETGLAPAAEWQTSANPTTGTGVVSKDSPNASPRIDNFAAWLVNENVVTETELSFNIFEPRNQVTELGEHSEEFIHCQVPEPEPNDEADAGPVRPGGPGQPVVCDRIQQFSFNTPYGAPEEAFCGRVAYSSFHVGAFDGSDGMNGSFQDVTFPEHCAGQLTDQEKVLLYMLFDLGACVGDPPPPPTCQPTTCAALNAQCGPAPDGCGGVLDCGPCTRPPAL